ncbi:hypothetical protein CANINC_000692 [Pichia inconspicua]|uniref:G protein-coupled receptor GPR1 C-terminal domain-containing protein n=1 Tax=Pichia inconspicua TaxID=52247 RepID=A0A4T0X5M3_9ASCO|nr:hypothetical protein CANINC_000692 [[Candida] inconspicua]
MALLIFHKEVRTLKQKFTAPDWMIQNVKFTKWYNYNGNSRGSKDSGSDVTHVDGGIPKQNVNTILQTSEGALHQHRFTVIFISVLFPILVASISFYVDNVYQGYIYFIFFRVWTGPWYFTWIVRHVIDLCIIVIYISIYVYVLMQFKKVSNAFRKRRHNGNRSRSQSRSRVREGSSSDESNDDDDDNDNDDSSEESENVMMNAFGDSIWYKIFKLCSMLIFPDVKIGSKLYGHSLDTEEDMENIRHLKSDSNMVEILRHDSVSTNEILGLDVTGVNGTTTNTNPTINKTQISKQIQNLMYEEAMERFKARKAQILNQMKIIFIYPISYLLIWLFPMINHYQIVRLKHESTWSTIAAALCQPLNGFVDTLVFMIREKPWQLASPLDTLTEKQVINSENDPLSGYALHGWRYYMKWMPGYYNYEDFTRNDMIFENVDKVEKATTYGRKIVNSTIASATGSSLNQEELDIKEFLKAGPTLQTPPTHGSRRMTLPTNLVKPKPAIVVPRGSDKRHSFVSWRTRSSVTSSNHSAGQQLQRQQPLFTGEEAKNRVEWNLNVFNQRESRSGSGSGSADSVDNEKMDIFDFLNSKPH